MKRAKILRFGSVRLTAPNRTEPIGKNCIVKNPENYVPVRATAVILRSSTLGPQKGLNGLKTKKLANLGWVPAMSDSHIASTLPSSAGGE